jgi:AraC-like DNA-binding protein
MQSGYPPRALVPHLSGDEVRNPAPALPLDDPQCQVQAARHLAGGQQVRVVVPAAARHEHEVGVGVGEGRVLTSAGVAAGIDLCLHIVRRDHGSELANRVARWMVVAPHRSGGQAVEEATTRCGFGTPVSLREHFRRATQTRPMAYRRAFRGKPAEERS